MFFNTFKAEVDDTEPIKKINLIFEFFGVAKPTIHAYVNGKYVGCSEKKLTGTITISENDYPDFFQQGTILEAYLNNTQTHQEIRSTTLRWVVLLKSAPRHAYFPPPISYISDSDLNKSMMLPPASACKGKLYHFKYLGTTRPFVVIPAMKDRSYPIEKSEMILLENGAEPNDIFESKIEGTWRILLEVQNQCVSVVSDGTEWLLVNNYEGTFTSICSGPLPESAMFEKNKSHFLNYYWNNDASNNIVITDLREHSLKFLHVHRFLPDTGFLNIYTPEGVGIEQTDVSGNERVYLSICLSNKALLSNTASFVFSFFQNRLYILSESDGAGFKVATYPTAPTISLESTLTIAGQREHFKIPSMRADKLETKLFIVKNKSKGRFILAANTPGEACIYTPKNGLRDCITYTKPLNKFCFWIIVYYDHGLEGQTTAVIINKYNNE